MCVRVRSVELLALLVADQALQLVEALQPEGLGEILVDLRLASGLHRLDGDREGRVLAGEIGHLIVGREGDLHLALVARLGADELVFEAGDQAARAKLDRHVLALAALEGLAADLAFEVHDDEVAHGRGMLLRRIFPALALGRELLDLLVDRSLVRLNGQPLDAKDCRSAAPERRAAPRR